MSRNFLVSFLLLLSGVIISQYLLAALPQSLPDDQEMPSLAPMLEKVTPAVQLKAELLSSKTLYILIRFSDDFLIYQARYNERPKAWVLV